MLDMAFSVFSTAPHTGVILIDTYSTFAFYYAWMVALLAQLLRIPYIPILHGGNLPNRITRNPKMSRRIFGHSFRNVVISEYLRKSIAVSGYDCITIPNNINIANYTFKLRTEARPKLLWVRSFHNIYNPEMAVTVVANLIKYYPGILLTMVGPDKDGSLQQCKNLALQLGVSDNITFTGKLSKQQWLTLSDEFDLFINTTNFDNQPVSVLEAMALGLPVISTNVGGLPFLLHDKVDSLLIPSGNADAMAEAIKSLIVNPIYTAELSQNARHAALAYDWQTVRFQWKSLLSDALNAQKKQ